MRCGLINTVFAFLIRYGITFFMFRARPPSDTLLFVLNVAVLTSSFYLFFTLLLLIIDWVSQVPFLPDQMVNSMYYDFRSAVGSISVICEILAGLLNGVIATCVDNHTRWARRMIVSIVCVLRFAVVVVCSRFSLSFPWFVAFASSCSGCISVGELVSLKLEMKIM